MKLHSKKLLMDKEKSTHKKSDFFIKQSEPITSNSCEFPMKPFKGTKSHLDDCEDSAKTVKSGKKRKADNNSSHEILFKKEKISDCDQSKIMSTLEKFSDIWNDCPDVENPRSGFEIVPNHKSESEVYDKTTNFVQKSKKEREPVISKWSIPNGSENAHFRDKHTSKSNDHQNFINSTKDNINNVKYQIVEDGHSIIGKYDSKLAELKRKKAVQEQTQLHMDQKNIIKKALSSMDGKQQVNKKIVFNDAEENEQTQREAVVGSNNTKTHNLFDGDDSSEADFELKVNKQFMGKKGQKLLELQSKFASDSRFTFDSRFHDSESENEKDDVPTENIDSNKEKKRQLEILESIVKQPIRPLVERKKMPVKKYDETLMVRFDPTREDHQKYVLKPQKPSQEEKEFKEIKNKKLKKEDKFLPNVQESKPEVSSEKVYAVKEDLKEVLKKETKTEFSLLKLFGSKDEDSNTQQEGSESVKKLKYATKNPFKYDSSESEAEEEERKVEEKKKSKSIAKPALPSWRTTFFFSENDPRLKEAQEFLKGPEDPEDCQEFAEKRTILKDFIRHKFKLNNSKKGPFKKKLGGVKKKASHRKKRM